MLYVTEKAAERVLLSAQASGCEGQALRVSAHQDESGKVHYRMGFDDQTQPGESRWVCNGVTLAVDAACRELLDDVVLDFRELPQGGPQFAFLAAREREPTPSP